MNERLKLLRKTLKLSQEEFGNRIGVTKASISRLESGINKITDQMEKSICREFNVEPRWFKNGEGDMFASSDDDVMVMIDRIMTGEDEFRKNLFKTFATADEEDLKALEHMIDFFLEIKKADD